MDEASDIDYIFTFLDDSPFDFSFNQSEQLVAFSPHVEDEQECDYGLEQERISPITEDFNRQAPCTQCLLGYDNAGIGGASVAQHWLNISPTRSQQPTTGTLPPTTKSPVGPATGTFVPDEPSSEETVRIDPEFYQYFSTDEKVTKFRQEEGSR